MRSNPASILNCSTSFLAWAMLLVVDILIHQTAPTQEKTGRYRETEEKNDCRDVAPPRGHYPVVQQCQWVNATKRYLVYNTSTPEYYRTKEQWTFIIPFQACGFLPE